MARYSGTTTQRGLGQDHVSDKRRLLAQLRDGDPCWRCGQPMYRSQKLDRDHVVDRALGGAQGPAVLAHAACNRAAGAKAGNQAQPRVIAAAGRDTVCRACGKAYHYAARTCEVCGVHYHPSGAAVRTCSRTCGVVLRKRVYGHAGARAARPKPPCAVCGKACRPGNRFCSTACAGAGAVKPRFTPIAYYTCRYCGKAGVIRDSAKPGRGRREVCEARACQLARIQANNLVTRNGLTREQADAQMTAIVRRMASKTVRSARQW